MQVIYIKSHFCIQMTAFRIMSSNPRTANEQSSTTPQRSQPIEIVHHLRRCRQAKPQKPSIHNQRIQFRTHLTPMMKPLANKTQLTKRSNGRRPQRLLVKASGGSRRLSGMAHQAHQARAIRRLALRKRIE